MPSPQRHDARPAPELRKTARLRPGPWRPGALAVLGLCAGLLGCGEDGGELPAPLAVPGVRLTVAAGGDGAGLVESRPAGIRCGASCEADFPPGTEVTLTASADIGSTFAGWSGACQGREATCTVRLADGAQAATATFGHDRETICTADRICWSDPLPLGAYFKGAWVFGPSDVWAVGDLGTTQDRPVALHYDGKGWAWAETGAKSGLRAAWASGPTDLWAVGGAGTAVRFDGRRFSAVETGTTADLNDVWVAGPGRVFAAGSDGNVYERRDGAWTARAAGLGRMLYRITGSAADDVWVGGDSGEVTHWDGTAFGGRTKVTTGVLRLAGLVATARRDVFAVDAGGNAVHFDGTAWSPLPATPGSSVYGMFATARGDVLVGAAGGQLFRWDRGGAKWQTLRLAASTALLSGHGDASGELVAVGQAGTLARQDGADLAPMKGTRRVLQGAPVAVWAAGPRAVFAVSRDGSAARWDGERWVQTDLGLPPGSTLNTIFGTSERDVWIAGDDSDGYGLTVHWDGGTWKSVPVPAHTDILTAGWASSPGDAWVVGFGGTVLHWDGTAWIWNTTPATGLMLTIWGSDRGNVWAGGISSIDDPLLLHYDGSLWTMASTDGIPGGVFNLSGTGPSDVWMLTGDSSAALRYDGTAWQRMPVGVPTRGLFSVWASSRSDVWLGGEGQLLHFDGSAFRALDPGSPSTIGGISGSGPESVWFASGTGLLRFTQ